MKSSLKRHARSALLTTAAVAAAVGGTAGSVGTAQADAFTWTSLTAGHNVGIYDWMYTDSGKHYSDLMYADHAAVHVTCWYRGETINNLGNVWYHIDAANYTGKTGPNSSTSVDGWVYGAYVDNNGAFHYGGIPECSE